MNRTYPDRPTVRERSTHTALEDQVPRIDSEALFNGGQAVILVHEGADYVLRITRNGKLILNK